MRRFSLGFVAGVALLQQQAQLPDGQTILSVLLLVAAALAVLWSLRPILLRRPAAAVLLRFSTAPWQLAGASLLLAAGAALLGFCWAALLAQSALHSALHPLDEGRTLRLVGLVESLPSQSQQGVRFNFRVEQVLAGALHPVPQHLALGWYSNPGKHERTPTLIQPGQRWRLSLRLQRPHGNANPSGFDYEVWLLEQGIRATGYVFNGGDNVLLTPFVSCFACVIEAARANLRARIETVLAGRRYAGVIVALVLGDQRGISQADWQVYTRSGISHLISISGLHITMVAGLFALLVQNLWRHSFFTRAQLPLLLPAQKVAALAGTVAAVAYVLLAGFGVPAQRTLYMLCVLAVALWSKRMASISHVLACALLVVVVLDPWAVLWPGFWLSFAAVAVLVYAGGAHAHAHQHGERWLMAGALLTAAGRAQYAVTLGLVPLSMLLFAQVSLVSPLANAIAIPLISLVVTPLALLGSVLPGAFAAGPLLAAHALVAWLAQTLAWCAALPWAVWSAPTPSFALFCWAMWGTLWLLAPRGWPVRWLGLAGWLPLLAAEPTHPPAGALRVTAFDVGQGMALLIETAQHRLLYDTGPAYGPDANAGARVLLPYLRARGIGRLDMLVLSHSDMDHSGGARAVLDALPVTLLQSSLPAGHPLRRAAKRHLPCIAGQHWEWDGVQFEFLHPAVDSYADPSLKPNARGCTLKVTARAGSMLLAADIEAAQERSLAQQYGSQLRADVLLAPHHGSKTSSTVEFLQVVAPRHAVFQLGYRNRYHHPHALVWARYAGRTIACWRTDQNGAITLDFGQQLHISGYRQQQTRYWYGR